MVDSETIDEKVSDKKEEFEEKVDEEVNEEVNEEVDEENIKEEKTTFESKKEEFEEKIEDKKERSKTIADNVLADLYKTIDEVKDSIKNMQKAADKKYTDYKKTTVQTIDIDLIETKDVYYIKAAVPGVEKDDILIEAGDNDITIETTFKPYIEEFKEEDGAELIASSIKTGRCVKTVRFENSIDLKNITAKFNNGIIIIDIPKLIIPKHKVNVE